ncbi:MAG TPA: type II toxin-antitoxin system VapC family toxin [Geminicoccaceae bacterium]
MLVVDASIAVKWVTEEDGSEAAAGLLSAELIAPDLWLAEAANAIWAKLRRRLIEVDHARDAIHNLLDAPVRAISVKTLLPAAFGMACELAHPVYDCLYLAAAELNDTRVITADQRFFEHCSSHSYLGRRIGLL